MIGNEAGTVAYYQHTGTYPNIFTLVDANWVGIDMSSPFAPSGYSVPSVIYGSDTTLLIGSEDQGIVHLDSLATIMAGATNVDAVFGSGPDLSPGRGARRRGRRAQRTLRAEHGRPWAAT